ncbi:MAG: alpha-galactosidase [Caldilineaceae bacterium]|nr:alpha-galactosidase [Caldilineaceae bacterium]
MATITIIGSGSLVFTRRLCSDFLLTPSLEGCEIRLMDIDPERLRQSHTIVQSIADRMGARATVTATDSRIDAVRGTDYVITTFQAGGLEAFRTDIEIPQQYGIEQCVGDTLGPGGVFRALRTIPVLLDLCRDLDDVAPDAMILNYVNPMAMNCWAIDRGAGRPHVGLCHSVQGTSEMLAKWIDVPIEDVNFQCAGINHQSFFTEFRRGYEDLYPLIRKAVLRKEVYGSEPVRIEMMNHFGYFVTESSGHASEYLPYFRKNEAMVDHQLAPKFTDDTRSWYDFGRTGGYLRSCIQRLEHFQSEFDEIAEQPVPTERSHEYGVHIIEAMETNMPCKVNGNVPNRGLMPSLPEGCCVEVPCLVDSSGVQPCVVDDYPPQLAGLNRTNINVQEMVVEASLTGSVDAVHHAVLLDPLSAAVGTMPQLHHMVDEMLERQACWLPQFNGA